jgi:hypothetical protein
MSIARRQWNKQKSSNVGCIGTWRASSLPPRASNRRQSDKASCWPRNEGSNDEPDGPLAVAVAGRLGSATRFAGKHSPPRQARHPLLPSPAAREEAPFTSDRSDRRRHVSWRRPHVPTAPGPAGAKQILRGGTRPGSCRPGLLRLRNRREPRRTRLRVITRPSSCMPASQPLQPKDAKKAGVPDLHLVNEVGRVGTAPRSPRPCLFADQASVHCRLLPSPSLQLN